MVKATLNILFYVSPDYIVFPEQHHVQLRVVIVDIAHGKWDCVIKGATNAL